LNPSIDEERDGARPAVSSGAASTSEFLKTLFLLLDEYAVRYCVLHSWESLPFELLSDLDLAVHPEDRAKLPPVFRKLQELGYRLIQCFNYSVNAYYFVFCWFEDLSLHSVPLDFIFEHWRSGLSVLSVPEIIDYRERYGEMWIPSRQHQFAYLLAKKIWKGKAPLAQGQQLKQLVEVLGRRESEAVASKIFLGRWSQQIVAACLEDSVSTRLKVARKRPWMTAVIRHPLQLIRYVWQQGRRVIKRWLYPTGILIAVLGPDGSGKDTVITGMSHALGRGFRSVAFYHWRPNVLFPRKPAPPVTNPHAKPLRGKFISSLYLAGFVLDYWIAYAFRIRHRLTRSTLVIFDRYFYDIIVDPKRARFGGPVWVAELLARMVPRPDLTLLLDADERVMYARKGELPVAELRRQRQAYRELSIGRSSRKRVQTDQTIEKSIADATAAVVKYLHERFERRDEEWLRQSALPNVGK
jgi:thymidylate kinase